MRKLSLVVCVLLIGFAARAGATTLKFDDSELSPQSVNGVTFLNVLFGFTSSDAYYNSGDVEDASTALLDDHVLEGDAAGTLTLNFLAPINLLTFAVALDTTDPLVFPTSGYFVELFNPGSMGVTPKDTNPLVLNGFSEGFFSYSGTPITKAVINFNSTDGTCAFEGQPDGRCSGTHGRFGLDDLTYDIAPPPGPQPVPEPASLSLVGLGLVIARARARARRREQ